jgi:hypothetical protein
MNTKSSFADIVFYSTFPLFHRMTKSGAKTKNQKMSILTDILLADAGRKSQIKSGIEYATKFAARKHQNSHITLCRKLEECMLKARDAC